MDKDCFDYILNETRGDANQRFTSFEFVVTVFIFSRAQAKHLPLCLFVERLETDCLRAVTATNRFVIFLAAFLRTNHVNLRLLYVQK